MSELIALFNSLGFEDVRTYLQSGNVIFNTAKGDIKVLSNIIEEKIHTVFGFHVPAIFRMADELEQIIKVNPLVKQKGIELNNLYVTFLSDVPGLPAADQIKEKSYGPDEFIILNREIYLYCPNGYGRTKYSNDFFERKLGITCTTRNWKTVNALLDIAKNSGIK
jgi:uncharacterized protein (DUF1697 family)